VRSDPAVAQELTEIGFSGAPLPDRAEAILHTLRLLVPYDGAWMALNDPRRGSNSHLSLADSDLDSATLEHFCGPVMARDMELTGANRDGPPMGPSDLPYRLEEVLTWAECLLPAGYVDGLGMSLFARGRHVGFLTVLFEDGTPRSPKARNWLWRLAPAIAEAIDPMSSLVAAARLVQGATSGVVLRHDRRVEPLPGLASDGLLSSDSQVMDVARAVLSTGQVCGSFLWPLGGRHAPAGHARVTALSSTEDVRGILTGLVVVSPPGDLRELTPRELEVLGLLVEGCSNAEIAQILVVAQRTVAAHVEHILAKLKADSRTLAAVRAEREGLYVPRCPSPNGE
jgi:DNA-binding CsgD family transcriptional regulator